MTSLYTVQFLTPPGNIQLIATDNTLLEVSFVTNSSENHLQFWKSLFDNVEIHRDSRTEILIRAIGELQEYFAGTRRTFTIPIKTVGTPFQRKVWEALRSIPYGKTLSYKALAKKIGQPQAARAVGSANGKNRLSIIIPCHRVINASGNWGGYSAGLNIKKWLLQHEASFSR